jgi:AcrR family transcriptional regulator
MPRLAVGERRRLLLAAATRVIARDGLAATSTRAVTAEAGMTKGTFHCCFRSKDELLTELVRTHVKDMIEAARAVWADDRSLAVNLREGIQAMVRVGMDDPGGELFSYELAVYALRQADTATVAAHQYADYRNQAIDYLRFVADRAAVDWAVELPTLARLFAVMVDGSMIDWLAGRDTEATMASVAAFADLLAAAATPLHGSPSLSPLPCPAAGAPLLR